MQQIQRLLEQMFKKLTSMQRNIDILIQMVDPVANVRYLNIRVERWVYDNTYDIGEKKLCHVGH